MVHAREPVTIIDEGRYVQLENGEQVWETVHEPHKNYPRHEDSAWECRNQDCPRCTVPPEHHYQEEQE
jgi:hypothetical protein